MTTEALIQFATPVAMIVLIVMQKRAAEKVASKVVTEAATVKTAVKESEEHRDQKLEVIHKLVNSEMSKAQEKIDEQRKEITAGLKKIDELHQQLTRKSK